jgi:AcrR family transcriptional regulator
MKNDQVSYVKTGRRKQKERTGAAIVQAARELLAKGKTPTVEDAAQLASVSRATAYRYFSTQRELLVAAQPEVEAMSLLGPAPSDDPSERLDAVVAGLADILLNAEASYRSMLRLSLDPDPAARGDLPLRQGRRFLWIAEALEPVRHSIQGPQYERLVNAIAASIGIEALVTLIDLGGLSPHQAVEVMRWSAQALLHQTLRDREIDTTL